MSKYLPVKFIKNQWKQAFYRIYINIFSIFFGIKLLPLRISKIGVEFYYKGDTVIWKFPWKRKNNEDVWISFGFSGTGEFGDAIFPDLKTLDKDWNEYFNVCAEINDNENSDPSL